MSAENYVRSFTSSILFTYIPEQWQEVLRDDLLPWETRKYYINQQLLPVLISTGLYTPVFTPVDTTTTSYPGTHFAPLGFPDPEGPFGPGIAPGQLEPMTGPIRDPDTIAPPQPFDILHIIPNCPYGSDCRDRDDLHRDTYKHPCRFGSECRFLARNDKHHIFRYTHEPQRPPRRPYGAPIIMHQVMPVIVPPQMPTGRLPGQVD